MNQADLAERIASLHAHIHDIPLLQRQTVWVLLGSGKLLLVTLSIPETG